MIQRLFILVIICYLSRKSKGCHTQGDSFIFRIALRDIERIERGLWPKLTEDPRCFFLRVEIEISRKFFVAINVCNQILLSVRRMHLVCSTCIFIQEGINPYVIL